MPSSKSRASDIASYDRLLDGIAQKYEPRIAREIARAMRQAGNQYANPLGDNTWRQKHVENMAGILAAEWSDSGRAHTNKMASNVKSSPVQMERKAEIDWSGLFSPEATNLAIAEWIGEYGGERITEVADTTVQDINAIIAQAEIEGLSERETGRLIYEVAPSKSMSRAQTIARTEAHGAGQGVSLDVAKMTNVSMVKVWISNESGRTRDAHRQADGQKIALDGVFMVDGERLRYPGDPRGSAGNTINCRCTIGYDVA